MHPTKRDAELRRSKPESDQKPRGIDADSNPSRKTQSESSLEAVSDDASDARSNGEFVSDSLQREGSSIERSADSERESKSDERLEIGGSTVGVTRCLLDGYADFDVATFLARR